MKHRHRAIRAEPAPVVPEAAEALPPQAGSPPCSREQQIREAAYLLYESRGCAPGHELEDWLAAEAAIEATPAIDERTAALPAI
jgi:hypothetical protein